jgi:hypothetical protein
MIYTDKTKKAMKFCFKAHKDQVDKSGMLSFILTILKFSLTSTQYIHIIYIKSLHM